MSGGSYVPAEENRMYRHEYKYLVAAGEIPLLRERIAGLMTSDRHASGGQYSIRSVYFDDMGDRSFHENDAGVDRKSKYRIRIYNASDARILLERKEGFRGKKYKTSDLLTRPQAEQLLRGRYIRGLASPFSPSVPIREEGILDAQDAGEAGVGTDPSAGAQERAWAPYKVLPGLCADMMTNRMRPVIIVEYDRIPYVYKYGNVRVTFDLNISSSTDIGNFFSRDIVRRPIMPAGRHLMEVKFDEFLPDAIYRALQLGTLKQTTFSKYYLCRIYS